MARDARKERQWREWIGARQDSGLTVRDFCRRHRLGEGNFYAWRRELQHRDTKRPAFVAASESPHRTNLSRQR